MDPTAFAQTLASQGKQYELLSGRDTPCCRMRFTGMFDGVDTIWDATLMSLAYYLQKQAATGESAPAARQFIEIGDMCTKGRKITIALQVPVIDEPTIIKTMIMVRQYKRLAPGKHEYGQTHTL